MLTNCKQSNWAVSSDWKVEFHAEVQSRQEESNQKDSKSISERKVKSIVNGKLDRTRRLMLSDTLEDNNLVSP